MSEKSFEKIRTLVAILIALLIAFVVIFFVSKTPFEAMKSFVIGPFANKRYLGNVIEAFIPLAFAGLATSILFQANLFNLGTEGLYYISGLIAAIIAIKFHAGPFILPLVAILVASTVAMILSIIPGFLKAKYNANELVTSLMFNNIYFGIGLFYLNNFLRDPSQTDVASLKFQPAASLPIIIKGTRIHAGLIILVIVAILVYVFLYKTKHGFNLRMVGLNSFFSENMGVKTFG